MEICPINAETGYGIEEAFRNFIENVVDDLDNNRMDYDELIDENWDESIKIKNKRLTQRNLQINEYQTTDKNNESSDSENHTH